MWFNRNNETGEAMTEAIIFPAFQLGEFPMTRADGRELRGRLEDQLANKRSVDLTIDFSGVEAMTISFADEFLGRLMTSFNFAATDTTVKLAGLNDENYEAADVCVERRESCVVVLDAAGSLALVGQRSLSSTFQSALELGEFKANDLASALGLSAQNANNRLKRLTEAGALRKSQVTGSGRGGREYIYTPVPAATPNAEELADA
jgi:DNA-binding transcriptional ArsR family regulator